MSSIKQQQTTNIVIAALGGEGGGTLSNWIEEVAHQSGWYAQTTSIAGVAQRTGATIYYIEIFPKSEDNHQLPVMSMFPAPGDIDVAISSEISEAGRLIQRGFCSKDRTTLIASSHHVYGITEKVMLGDGGIDNIEIARVAEQQCKKLVSFDMREIAEQHNTVISATLLGALAGSKALPFNKEDYVSVISLGGKMVENNLAAFNASYNKAIAPGLVVETAKPANARPQVKPEFALPEASTIAGAQLMADIRDKFPLACHQFVTLGVVKLIDYQDYDYAQQYLDDLQAVLALDSAEAGYQLTTETARYLALWMSFEDTARVAQIKTRESRQAKIRDEVKAERGQIIHVTEYFAPRLEELVQPLPAGLARAILNSPLCVKLARPFTKGRRLRTDTILSFSLLRMMAASRRWRRHTYTYQHETGQIKQWLEQIKSYAVEDRAAAIELSKCARIVKGYGKTRERGSQQIEHILARARTADLTSQDFASLREAALADDSNIKFSDKLAMPAC